MMPPDLRRDLRRIIGWGLVIFVVINAFSWNPGWGGRNDRKPGREVERYFGWPACFYCDLWRSDHDHEIALAAYFPPIPLSREMDFVYFRGSVIAFLLNATLVACGTVICLILVAAERERKNWMIPVEIGLAVLGLLILMFSGPMNAYL